MSLQRDLADQFPDTRTQDVREALTQEGVAQFLTGDLKVRGDCLDLNVWASRLRLVEFEGLQDLKQFNVCVRLIGFIRILSK